MAPSQSCQLRHQIFQSRSLIAKQVFLGFQQKIRKRQHYQLLDLKGRNFLELVDSDNITLEPTYCKGGPWFQAFGHLNLLCARATRAITNHAPIGEYRLKFFPKEDFSCPYGLYPIESR